MVGRHWSSSWDSLFLRSVSRFTSVFALVDRMDVSMTCAIIALHSVMVMLMGVTTLTTVGMGWIAMNSCGIEVWDRDGLFLELFLYDMWLWVHPHLSSPCHPVSNLLKSTQHNVIQYKTIALRYTNTLYIPGCIYLYETDADSFCWYYLSRHLSFYRSICYAMLCFNLVYPGTLKS